MKKPEGAEGKPFLFKEKGELQEEECSLIASTRAIQRPDCDAL